MEVEEGVEGAHRLFLKHQKKVLWAGELGGGVAESGGGGVVVLEMKQKLLGEGNIDFQ